LLSTARTTAEAVRELGRTDALVSHLVVMQDAAGRSAAVERVPGSPPFTRWLGDAGVVTNHLEGPHADDAKNLRVKAATSTLDRRRRGDELVSQKSPPATAGDAVQLLRDRATVRGEALPLGDRRAIDALIATHGVVFESRSKRVWVSESPHLLGKFVALDAAALFSPPPGRATEAAASLPEDPLLGSDAHLRFLARGREENR
jgi:hypothetical protein